MNYSKLKLFTILIVKIVTRWKLEINDLHFQISRIAVGEGTMRKAFIIFATLLMLVACENNSDPTKESTIGTADLTKREQAILTTTAGKSFVYDFSVDNDYKNVNIFVERYEFGKLVSENPNGVTMSLDDEKKRNNHLFSK